ncbi:four helix bundle protein [Candidatus Poribacteria bacterium]|nr:four helix bundle protein [Candidatus Poribacteria bacterium]
MVKFAIRIIKLSSELPKTPEGMVVKTQITKSGTSAGANYHEAKQSTSRADFNSKIDRKPSASVSEANISVKELAETKFWLKVIMKSKMLSEERVKRDFDECCELLSLFLSSAKSSS